MGLLDIFKKKPEPTAGIAKGRLLVALQASKESSIRPEYFDQMHREILEVVNKYVKVDITDISTNINNEGDTEILELSVLLPETAIENDAS